MPPDELRRILALLLDGVDTAILGVASGQLTPDAFQAEMVRRLFEGHVAAYLVGRDVRTLSPEGERLVKAAVVEQIDYLNKFVDTIAAEGWRDSFAARAQLYAGSVKATFWKGRTFGLEMPYYPAQGTQCLNNCGCSWRIDWIDQENLDANATWVRGKSDSCATCISREMAGTIQFREGVRA